MVWLRSKDDDGGQELIAENTSLFIENRLKLIMQELDGGAGCGKF
jgi:hypothetical protein